MTYTSTDVQHKTREREREKEKHFHAPAITSSLSRSLFNSTLFVAGGVTPLSIHNICSCACACACAVAAGG